jgi:hypothetical protein
MFLGDAAKLRLILGLEGLPSIFLAARGDPMALMTLAGILLTCVAFAYDPFSLAASFCDSAATIFLSSSFISCL